MMSYQTILAIGSGGFLGAISRAYLTGVFNKLLPNPLPFGTLSVNLIGSFIIGVLFAYFSFSSTLSPHIKSFLTTGFLGALTTYSTFAIESFWLFESGSFFLAFLNLSLNAIGTTICAGVGFKMSGYIFKALI